MKKYLSRKFLICVAAFLGSIGTSIAALTRNYPVIAVGGIICSTLSAAIYAACEAYVDAADLGGDIQIINGNIEEEEEVEDAQ